MKSGTILIHGKEYPYVFNFKARRLFMEKRGYEYHDQYLKELQKLEKDSKSGMLSMSGMLTIGDLILTAIQAAYVGPLDLDVDDLMDSFESDINSLNEVIKNFTASQEQSIKSPRSSAGKSRGVRRK